jgi:hypothetical protein
VARVGLMEDKWSICSLGASDSTPILHCGFSSVKKFVMHSVSMMFLALERHLLKTLTLTYTPSSKFYLMLHRSLMSYGRFGSR